MVLACVKVSLRKLPVYEQKKHSAIKVLNPGNRNFLGIKLHTIPDPVVQAVAVVHTVSAATPGHGSLRFYVACQLNNGRSQFFQGACFVHVVFHFSEKSFRFMFGKTGIDDDVRTAQVRKGF